MPTDRTIDALDAADDSIARLVGVPRIVDGLDPQRAVDLGPDADRLLARTRRVTVDWNPFPIVMLADLGRGVARDLDYLKLSSKRVSHPKDSGGDGGVRYRSPGDYPDCDHRRAAHEKIGD